MSVDARIRKVREWLRYAQADLRAATQIINASTGFEPYHAGFWAQQGAEKAIKAALIFANIPFEPTHNLNSLVLNLPPDWRTRRFSGRLGHLTSYGVDMRYPDPYEHSTAAEAAQAVRDARAVFTAVCRDLQARGMTIRFVPHKTVDDAHRQDDAD